MRNSLPINQVNAPDDIIIIKQVLSDEWVTVLKPILISSYFLKSSVSLRGSVFSRKRRFYWRRWHMMICNSASISKEIEKEYVDYRHSKSITISVQRRPLQPIAAATKLICNPRVVTSKTPDYRFSKQPQSSILNNSISFCSDADKKKHARRRRTRLKQAVRGVHPCNIDKLKSTRSTAIQ